ncbi:MAG: VWA domain-containing protein [Bacteroidales bacterium]|nr:VWA domain-containing protein [Bacteroidales bacterium]
MIARLSFAHPWLLLALAIVPLLAVYWFWRYRRQHSTFLYSTNAQFASAPVTLRQRLFPLLYILRLLAIAMLIVALARPQSQLSRQEMTVEGIDIVLAMDVSGSMLAEDFKPNRLEAAKKVAADFIDGRRNDRIGLVVFAGEAFTQIPLTIDHKVLLDQLAKVKSGQIKDGTALGDGLATAINRIKDSKARSKVIILLTDGINNMGSVDPQNAAEIAALYDIRLYTIGVGRQGMAPFPYKTAFGTMYQNVPVEIDEQLLTQMAETTQDGHYFRSTSKKSLTDIFAQIDQMEKTKIDVTRYNQTKDEYLPFLLLGLACLVVEVLLQVLYFKR